MAERRCMTPLRIFDVLRDLQARSPSIAWYLALA